MKKSIFYLVAIVMIGGFSQAVNAQGEPIENGAKITFQEEMYDYGDVPYDGHGYHTFIFENTGNEPLVLGEVKGSCSCTVPDWPRTPIAPGEKGEIRVKYDTKKVGAINKSVTVNSNAVNTPIKVIRIQGNVLPAPVTGAPVDASGAPVND
jgi:hypothetical protein